MSVSAKAERTVCVLLPNKEKLEVTVEVKATGQDVLRRVSDQLGIKDLHFFGLSVVKDNEHIFLDLDAKLTKYFPKEWKQDFGKVPQRFSPPFLLCLKVQYYVENGHLVCDRKARRLYYADVRERVLHSECRQQEALYFELAGYALQADFGDHPHQHRSEEEGQTYFQPKDYFPPWILAKRGVTYILKHGPKIHKELGGMSARNAILLFIRESCHLEDVPVTFYRLQKDKKEERGSALLGLTLRGMQVYQEVNSTRELLFDFPWFNVGRLTFLGKKFEIQPDGLPSARKLVYYTGSAFRSRHLLYHLSNSHRLYLNIQPAVKHLRQLEETKEKRQYRESYISDDLDLDHAGSDDSPGLSLSRHSTNSSGVEVDTCQRALGKGLADSFGSAASRGSSHTSGIDAGSKAQPDDDEEWQDDEAEVSVDEPEEVSVDGPQDLERLVELQEGMSVDGPRDLEQLVELQEGASVDPLPSDTDADWTDATAGTVDTHDYKTSLCETDDLQQVFKWRTRASFERYSQSMEDIRHYRPPTLRSGTLLPDTSHSYTFGLPDPDLVAHPTAHSYCSIQCTSKPTFYGRRSTNCLSLDLLGDEQLLEFIV